VLNRARTGAIRLTLSSPDVLGGKKGKAIIIITSQIKCFLSSLQEFALSADETVATVE
jgi:hypothetical protein